MAHGTSALTAWQKPVFRTRRELRYQDPIYGASINATISRITIGNGVMAALADHGIPGFAVHDWTPQYAPGRLRLDRSWEERQDHLPELLNKSVIKV